MFKLIVTFLMISLCLTLLVTKAGKSPLESKEVLKKIHPHRYKDTTTSLDEISLLVLYFVPKDKVNSTNLKWFNDTTTPIKKLEEFHDIQLKGTSNIHVSYAPEIIIGEKPSLFYEKPLIKEDSDSLTPIKEEITRRFLNATTTSINSEFFREKKIGYPVYMVIFEGEGGFGNENFALVSRSYLTSPFYKNYAATFLAHEFYHTLGLLDNYQKSAYVYADKEQTSVSLLTEVDIMGRVTLPLDQTYINKTSLEDMGL